MGCDIHLHVETRSSGKWKKFDTEHFTLSEWDKKYEKREKTETPFDWRDYSMFAFFADVRNYDHCVPLSEPKGLPDDSEYLNEIIDEGYGTPMSRSDDIYNDGNYHSFSYLTLKELLDFDYEQTFWNRRITKTVRYPEGGSYSDGAALAEEGEGQIISYRENLGSMYFTHLKELSELGEPEDVRIVFWFDN